MTFHRIEPKRVIVSGLFALSGSAWFYLSTLNSTLVSKRDLLAVLIVWGLLFLGAWACIRYSARTSSSPKLLSKPLLVAFLLAIPLAAPIPGSLSYLQVRELRVRALPGTGTVILDGLNEGQIDVPHARFVRPPSGWDETDNHFISTGPGLDLTWSGRTSNHPSLTFRTGPGMGTAVISWDDQVQEVSLDNAIAGQRTVQTLLPIRTEAKVVYRLVGLIFFTTLLLLLYRFVISLPRAAPDRIYPRYFWLKYALPTALTCLFVLCVYFPGLMSGDSLVQWGQAHTLHFTDHHPVFHTLFIWLATRVWDSPAAAALGQIFYLSVVVGWGIGKLEKRGLPETAAWIVSALFAFSPVNGLYGATLWKDIPYAVSLLWLTIILAELYFTDGRWLTGWRNFSALAACLLAISLFRHNGFPVALAVILILIAVFRSRRIQSLALLGVVLGLRGLITGPLYRVLDAQPAPTAYQYSPVLYHLGAHVKAGTPLSESDRRMIEQLLPLSAWDYSPCSSDPIVWNPNLNAAPLQAKPLEYIQLAVKLFLQEPRPDIMAVRDIGSLVYSIEPVCTTYVSPLFYKPASRSGATWIDFKTDGIPGEASFLPGMVAPLSKFYAQTLSYNSFRLLNILLWRPAAYLLIAVLAALAFTCSQRQWKALVIAAPALVQSMVLMAINVSQEVRYQYGVYLIALYLIGLLGIALRSHPKNKS